MKVSFELNKDIILDEEKVRRLRMSIYHMERKNLQKKRPLSNPEMVENIVKEIEREVKRCY